VTPEAALTLTGRADTSSPVGRTALHLGAERDMEKLLLTVEEAAEVLGISRTKVFALIASGAVRSVMIGGSRRVVADGLRDYVSRLSMELARYGQ